MKNTTALAAEIEALAAEVATSQARLSALMTILEQDVPAGKAPAAPKVTKPKADVRYRTQAQKDAAKDACDRNWAEAKKAAGVKRCSQLTPAQRKAVEVKNRAEWASRKGTRKTPVAKG